MRKSGSLAPIGISTYKRLGHLQQCIEALKSNHLAQESCVFVFSDGPQQGDEQKVAEVRQYLSSVTGFKSLEVVRRESNNRIWNNREGLKRLLFDYGKVIWVEEDIVTMPGFLSFMNSGLEYYRDDARIMSITGYCPPIGFPATYEGDVFFLRRFNAWGYATWYTKDSLTTSRSLFLEAVNRKISVKEYLRAIHESSFRQNLQLAGSDYINMALLRETLSIIDAGDHKITFTMAENDMFTVYPVNSLSVNIGMDGSGTHCGVTSRHSPLDQWMKTEDFHFVVYSTMEQEIVRNYLEYRRLSVRKWIYSWWYKILIRMRSFLVKNID